MGWREIGRLWRRNLPTKFRTIFYLVFIGEIDLWTHQSNLQVIVDEAEHKEGMYNNIQLNKVLHILVCLPPSHKPLISTFS